MSGATRQLLSACCFGLALLAPAAVAAQSAEEQAEAEYGAGVEDFKASDFEGALAHFEKAYLLDPSPILIYNLARAHEELGNAEQAIKYFETYLVRAPEAPDRPDVERRIRVMKAILEKANKEEPPPPPPEEEEEEKAEEPPPEPEPEPEPPPPADEGTNLMPWAWTAIGVGVAAAGAGVYFGLEAQDAEERNQAAANDPDRQDELDSTAQDAEDNATLATAMFVTSGVLIATGATLWILDATSGEQSAAIAPTPGGAMASWSLRF